jgi:hypothetical protein
MTRAGKEPAEDVKRAFQRAIELAGLKAHRVEMFKAGGALSCPLSCGSGGASLATNVLPADVLERFRKGPSLTATFR